MIFAGSSVVAGKILVGTLPVFASQLICLAVSLVVIIPIALKKEGKISVRKIGKINLLYIFLQALFGIFLFRIFLLIGMKYTTALEAGIITSSGPVILALLSVFLLRENISSRVKFAMGLCTAGLLMINISGGFESGSNIEQMGGNLLILLAVICEGLFSIFRKKLSIEDKPITITTLVILFSLLLFIPLGSYELLSVNINDYTLEIILALGYYGIFCTVIAYIFWISGLAHTKVSVAAAFTGLMPVSSIILSVLLLGEILYLRHIIGTVLVIISVFISTGVGFNYLKKLNYIRKEE